MFRYPLCLASMVVCIAMVLLSFNGCGGTSSGFSGGLIKHIVIIVQENRTPDNLFQDPVLISRHADIAQSGLNSKGQTIPLTQMDLAVHYDLGHNHAAFVDMYDGGKMDGADKIPVVCEKGYTGCPPPNLSNPQFVYVNPAEVQPYFQMAEQYTFGDRMFQTNQGPSFPAHQFLLAGTSAPTASSDLFAAENIYPGVGAGCIAPPGSIVKLINPAGVEATTQYPCFEHATLTDELDAKGISWRYYAPNGNYIWTAPDAIQHMCQPQSQAGTLVCTGSAWNNVIVPPKGSSANILKDIANNQLAQVSWVIPSGPESDHPQANDGSGPSWVASVVNAIGSSSYWANTAIIVTWDDWGGFYDHVPPPLALVNCSQWGCGYVYGFRVPLIVISPYAKAQYVSHVNHDFGSILKLVEQVFKLPSLGYADAANLGDLSDCFNFGQPPRAFQTITAPLTQEHFLNDPRPPSDPDDD
jgi:phospholipase C